MLAQPVTAESDPCEVACRWGISLKVSTMLGLAMRILDQDQRLFIPSLPRTPISIISGHRSEAHQEELCRDVTDRPCASAATSTHTSNPATGVDLRWEGATPADWRRLGAVWESLGGRWGGSFSTPDPNHFDLGPRNR